ncbi:hypothetical protein QR680_016831 [Steinernema hermaphroditum]|uniref:Uncharacterized protein n=1 Tax=Steinernema hermaphroditum TaxID=289476 RepID=A0AA39LN27_9BILA|nr:hypothetical protein QR680_016831 [Steinernema hermaphroditum]
MSRRSTEAHRAMDNLEAYYDSLTKSADNELRREVERLLSTFKNGLFEALVEIQDHIDSILMDERRSSFEKMYETKRIADRFEGHPIFGGRPSTLGTTSKAPLADFDSDRTSTAAYQNGGSSSHVTRSSYFQEHSERRETNQDGNWKRSEVTTRTVQGPEGSSQSFTTVTDDDGSRWEIEDIIVEKGNTGLGLSITGGIDQDGDGHVRVSNITPGGAVAADGRMRKDDIIIKVNNTECERVPHELVVNALKSSGNIVKFRVKRNLGGPLGLSYGGSRSSLHQTQQTLPSPGAFSYHQPPPPQQPQQPPQPSLTNIPIYRSESATERFEKMPGVQRIELFKTNKGLGFSIAGGVGNEHVPNDSGIYVTKLIDGGAAIQDGRLGIGDKLVAVDNISLENVSHDFAVSTLKNTAQTVNLFVIRNPRPEYFQNASFESGVPQRSGSFHQLQNQSMDSQQQQIGILQPHHYAPAEIPLHPRPVQLNKPPNQGLGFNIVGGEDGEPIYISYVLPGGVADLSGNVHKGDVLLDVNGHSLVGASHGEAALTLKNATSPVVLSLQHRPLDYKQFEAKIDQLRNDRISGTLPGFAGSAPPPRRDVFVRALFDYDAARETGVPHRTHSFAFGDVFHVSNTSDDEWWTARKVAENGDEGMEGLIPSKKRVEKRERMRRKQVNFNNGSQSLGRGATMQGGLEGRRGSRTQLSFSRKFPFVKSTERLNELNEMEPQVGINEPPILSYEAVDRHSINYVRPVLVLGAMKDRINDTLVERHPDRFNSCVPHTSRPPRPEEVNGRDYHFVSRVQMENDVKDNLFIEAGQFQDNLYGTSIAAVREVANSGRHCILDVSGNAIHRLQSNASMFPIAIFVKPTSYRQLMDWEPNLGEEAARSLMERCQRTESQFGELFTCIVTGHSPEEVVHKVSRAISEHSKKTIWIPTRQPLY